LKDTRDERGAILVIAAMILTVLMLVAAWAIDEAHWFVHHNHLQTEADAAALAAAKDFQCVPGTANTSVDTIISNTVHQYDGTASGSYNRQVWATPVSGPANPPLSAYSSTQSNLFSVVNRPSFFNQSLPNDGDVSGTATTDGSPCRDGSIDVKLTETNLHSILPFIDPNYVNAQARVSLEQLTASGNNEPLAIPNPDPTVVHGELVDEGNNGAPLGSGLVNLTSSDGTTWTGSAGLITFTGTGTSAIKGPIGLRVQVGGGSTCGTQLVCYDSGSNNGVTLTRVWANSGVPVPGTGHPTAPPLEGDAALAAAPSNSCPPTGITLSNFVSDSLSCNVQLNATVYFATGATCGSTPNVALTLSVSGQNPTMTCTGATTETTAPCSTTSPCVKTTWISSAVSVGADNPDGPVPFNLSYTQMFGSKPNGANGGSGGQCGTGSPKPCNGNLDSNNNPSQRAFNGAYDQTTSSSSRSGPITGAAVTDAAGNDLMSVPLDGRQLAPTITVNVLNTGAFRNVPDTATATAGTPVTVHTGASQGTYGIQCNGDTSSSGFTQYMATGCSQPFATTTQPNPPICTSPPPGPAVCVIQSPGTGKKVEPGMDCRVNGVITYPSGLFLCSPSTTCVSPNHWTAPNTVGQILDQNPPDPRLVQMLIVDSNAWIGVTGGSPSKPDQTPIRYIATFYVTGWTRGGTGGDPCTGQTTPTSPGTLPYTSDDDPGGTNNVLLGHFVQYTVLGGGGGGGGPGTCTSLTLGDCIAVLTR
jgi:hypothetical protein